ncbi:hypothetical protein SAY87_021930 [Trapa incisa]|uniref:Uncharacterized protein n=1 Tax=Trapa incisa TaxID=236973 RepID=A0AAN7JUA6_9MYRT|nr:hypothetical protein SAY87_021930 [Trapa incisa]
MILRCLSRQLVVVIASGHSSAARENSLQFNLLLRNWVESFAIFRLYCLSFFDAQLALKSAQLALKLTSSASFNSGGGYGPYFLS